MTLGGNLSLPKAEGDRGTWRLPQTLHSLASRNRGDADADDQPPCDTHCTALSCLFSASKQLCQAPTGTLTLRWEHGRGGAETPVLGARTRGGLRPLSAVALLHQ